MPRPHQPITQWADPSINLDELLHRLAGGVGLALLALVTGAGAARALRRRELHWSWALVGTLPALVAGGRAGAVALGLAAAALYAAARGRRWHRLDLGCGGADAAHARGLRRPSDLLARVASGAAHGITPSRGLLERIGRDRLLLGRDRRGRQVSIPALDRDGGRHILVVGATGSGKTVTQAWIAGSAIERGMGAVVIDPKGDPGLRAELERAAGATGRTLVEWAPDGATIYNPYARGSESEIADKTLAGELFTEPHYLRQAQRYIGHVVRSLRASGTEVTLAGIAGLLDPQQLEQLVRSLPAAQATATHAYLDSLSARQRADLGGVRDRLAILVESDVGPWLDPRTAGHSRFDLLASIRARSIVYFSLEADRRPLLAAMLGSAIVQDLLTSVAALQSEPTATVVVIDEFSAVAAAQVVRLFARARAAGLSLLLGTQELSDLRVAGHERLLEQVLGNLSVLIAHRQVVPRSAEMIAGLAGSAGAWSVSHHSDGRTTRRRTRQAILEPDAIADLGRGWATVITLAGRRQARLTRVCAPSGRWGQ
jgi:hypothetical protein